MAIVYVDPEYKGEARRALRKERKYDRRALGALAGGVLGVGLLNRFRQRGSDAEMLRNYDEVNQAMISDDPLGKLAAGSEAYEPRGFFQSLIGTGSGKGIRPDLAGQGMAAVAQMRAQAPQPAQTQSYRNMVSSFADLSDKEKSQLSRSEIELLIGSQPGYGKGEIDNLREMITKERDEIRLGMMGDAKAQFAQIDRIRGSDLETESQAKKSAYQALSQHLREQIPFADMDDFLSQAYEEKVLKPVASRARSEEQKATARNNYIEAASDKGSAARLNLSNGLSARRSLHGNKVDPTMAAMMQAEFGIEVNTGDDLPPEYRQAAMSIYNQNIVGALKNFAYEYDYQYQAYQGKTPSVQDARDYAWASMAASSLNENGEFDESHVQDLFQLAGSGLSPEFREQVNSALSEWSKVDEGGEPTIRASLRNLIEDRLEQLEPGG